MNIDILIFIIALIPIPVLVIFAKRSSIVGDEFGGKTYGRFMVGLSAAATGNSGFIMTGAVGLGYAYGLQWVLLPLSWLIGDLVFWRYGPKRINEHCRSTGCVNVAQVIAGNNKRVSPIIYIGTSLLLVVFLGAYISSQWVAGSKIISGFIGIQTTFSIIAIGIFVTGYCMIGKFRGSVYTDLYQGVLMVLVTIVSLYLALTLDITQPFSPPGGFDSLIGNLSIASLVGFVVGYAVAGIGFGFGQPQITSRYIAAKSPTEAAAAKWVYIVFLQFTWIGMTYFGYVLRKNGFVVEDPEAALVPFFQLEAGQVLTGLAVAGIFAAIASTVDSILVSITSLAKNRYNKSIGTTSFMDGAIILLVGGVTTVAAINTHGSVFAIALLAISMIGATLAGPVIIRLFGIRHTDMSIIVSLVGGGLAGYLWRSSEFGGVINEAVIGIAVAFILNYFVAYLELRRTDEAAKENV